MPELTAPITAVTVYTDRAQITRRGELELTETGPQAITIGGLPTNIQSDSLRVSGIGTAAVTILGVDSRTRYHTDPPGPELQDLQRQLDEIAEQTAALNSQKQTLDQRLTMLQKMGDEGALRYTRALAGGTATLEQAQALLDFVAGQTQATKDEQARLDRQLRDLGKQREVVQAQFDQRRQPRSRQDTLVTVPVEVGNAGDFTLELTYVVYGASWQPVYDIRIASPQQTKTDAQPSLDGTLTLNYLASLSQNTGEEWQGVQLTLSTARPSLGTLPPKLEPNYIDIYQPPVARPMMAMSAAAPASMARKRSANADMEMAESFAGGAMDDAPMQMQAEVMQAEVQSSGASVTFKLPRPLDVPADGQPHRTMITAHDYPCRLDYSSVPKLAGLAYLRATMTNSSDLTLLAGSANIFRDGEFVGNSQLEDTAPRQEVKLFLGPDEQVRTERELTGREVEKNFIGNNRRSNFSYTLKLENLKPYPVRLTVQDQIPVSRHESIKVKLQRVEPAPTEQTDLGILRWELVLPPGKREIRYEYQVEQPREVRVTGME